MFIVFIISTATSVLRRRAAVPVWNMRLFYILTLEYSTRSTARANLQAAQSFSSLLSELLSA